MAAAPTLLAACSALVSSSEAPAAAERPALEPLSETVAGTVDVVIRTAGWPLTPLPTREQLAADPARAGYAEALQSWLDANPGVAFEQVAANIWDRQAMVAALAGGTAPTWIDAQVIGGTQAGARAAFAQGLLADATPAIESYAVKSRLTPAAAAAWESLAAVDGKYFSYPIDAGINGVVWYRRDLLADLGLAEPGLDWTWADMRKLITALAAPTDKRKGLSAPGTYLSSIMEMHGWSLLTQLPAPTTSWNWSYDFSAPIWSEVAAEYRKLYAQDQAIVASDQDWIGPWIEGAAGLTVQNILSAFGPAEQPNTPAALARRLNKAYHEVVGFAPQPRGAGFSSSSYYVSGVAFSPGSAPEVLDKAAAVLDYMLLGDGYLLQKQTQWEVTGNLQKVYNNPLPIDGNYAYRGVAGTFADAWGERTLADLKAIAAIPPAPDRALFFPAEANSGPDTTALDEIWSTAALASPAVELSAELARVQETLNQQASGFNSSIDDATFVAAARAFYTAQHEFWQAHAPQFWERTFKPWYESKVQPELG